MTISAKFVRRLVRPALNLVKSMRHIMLAARVAQMPAGPVPQRAKPVRVSAAKRNRLSLKSFPERALLIYEWCTSVYSTQSKMIRHFQMLDS